LIVGVPYFAISSSSSVVRLAVVLSESMSTASRVASVLVTQASSRNTDNAASLADHISGCAWSSTGRARSAEVGDEREADRAAPAGRPRATVRRRAAASARRSSTRPPHACGR
jgi:hypothetical protein